MRSHDYDLILVGGGLAGSVLALNMARHGARTLVVERETAFRDRVRGEGVTPWGVAEARELGVFELLRDTCAREIRWWRFQAGPAVAMRDLIETTPQRAPALNFFHPEMQEVLLRAAAEAGAEVRRGARVNDVLPGAPPRVRVEHDGRIEELSARLVVGADGRGSRVRTWAGFTARQDPSRLFVGGVLLEGAGCPGDAVTLVQGAGRSAIFYPQRDDRVRGYAVYHRDLLAERLQGPSDLRRFFDAMIAAGTPPEWLADARAVGPLATFDGADSFVEHPYRGGVALLGDAAASSDPSWGQGLSLTLRDVRVLRDHLRRTDDWDVAAHAYAAEHDRYYATLRTAEDWMTRLFMEVGPDADARRERVLPLIFADPTRQPDTLFTGPDQPLGEPERLRFLGE